jgi:hypothetical protein
MIYSIYKNNGKGIGFSEGKPNGITQSLMNSESGILKSKLQRRKTVVASREPKPKGFKPNVLSKQKPPNFQHKAQKKKSKTLSTNSKGPIKIWVPKSEIVNVADIPKSKEKAKIMVLRQRFLKTHNRK